MVIEEASKKTPMKQRYDGIIIGTGHNALILQAYLSRHGLNTLSVDCAAVPGGGLSTIENPRIPGLVHNPHSFYHRAITGMPWYRDLELEKQGVSYIEPELNVAMILRDGRSLQWWTDIERTRESFAQYSAQDADSLALWSEAFRPIVEEILIPEAQSPPLPKEERIKKLNSSKHGRHLLEVSALSPLEFVMENFEHDVIRAGLLFFNGLREVDLRLPGFGHAIPALLASPGKAQMCVGGSANLAKGIIADIEDHGGEVQCNLKVSRILLKNGKACGIELSTGEQIQANGFVASGINPQQTFLQLIPESDLSERLRSQARGFQYNLLAPLFGLHLALTEPPRYAAEAHDANLRSAFMTILGLEEVGQFSKIVEAHEKGRIPDTVAWGSCPTYFDPEQGSQGKHTAFLWEKLPFRLHGDLKNWDMEVKRHGDDLLDFWREYAPNLDGDTILDQFSLSPLDTERTLPNMFEGDLLVGSFDNGQVGSERPFPGAGNYRAPISNLYLCGGSTHPGGNITGLCGYNAASVILADLGLA